MIIKERFFHQRRNSSLANSSSALRVTRGRAFFIDKQYFLV